MTDPVYLSCCEFVHSTKVTNDVAERGVAMIQTFTNTVTKNETELQWLLQEVEANQHKVAKFDKRTLSIM